MNRAVHAGFLSAALALAAAGSAAAPAQPAAVGTPRLDDLSRCAIEKHPNEARWFGGLLAKKVSLEPEVAGGAFLNALGELLRGCLVEGSRLDFDAFVASMKQFEESAPPARAGPMDALADCFLEAAPQEAALFLRESDIGAGKSLSALDSNAGGTVALNVSHVSDTAFQAMLSKSLSKSAKCDRMVRKAGDRLHGNQIYWRLNWRLRAEPKRAAGK
jgi:hypothetical protein